MVRGRQARQEIRHALGPCCGYHTANTDHIWQLVSSSPQLPCAVHGRRCKVLAVVGNVAAHDAPLVPFHRLKQRVVARRPQLDFVVVRGGEQEAAGARLVAHV